MADLNLHEAESLLHEALGSWAREHARRYPGVEPIAYNPEQHPEQRVDTFKTPTDTKLAEMPTELLVPTIRSGYLEVMGDAGVATLAALTAPDLQAPRSGSLGEQLRQGLQDGRNIAVLTAHADRLDDIGTFCGAIAVALGDANLIARNGTILNKAMTRETLNGVPIANLFRFYANIYWVVPETTSAARWRIEEDVTNYINANAMRALISDLRVGSIITFAPSGSAMIREMGPNGETLALIIPPLSPTTIKLVALFDAYVVVVLWGDNVSVGPLTSLPPRTGGSRAERRQNQADAVGEAMRAMAQMTQELAGVPVRFRGL